MVGNDFVITAQHADTLLDIARRHGIGFEEIQKANPGVDLWLPGEGTSVVIPGRHILPSVPREGIVVNLPENRLYYYPKKRKGQARMVITHPVSVGGTGRETPIGQTTVIAKAERPSWYPTESIRREHAQRGEPLPRVVPPGPDNPLGEFTMRLGLDDHTYLIHGTNNPVAIGMPVTHGCIRMYPEAVAALFRMVPVGTKVTLIDEPVKVGRIDGEVLIEVHSNNGEDEQSLAVALAALSSMIERVMGDTPRATDWELAETALRTASGKSTLIALEAAPSSAI
ncbi:L,D-transpeptidase family protein [Steroidobacter sp. S1-65]|uniref:L,D-transpeptidase family protein n=1 Tax=Steroidobacter gossypii TaxID=2805490 RepID=A0ABS1X3Q7_9GAMM|nr:L,D-transpeptidase family protein [Steroidobacter gossypii]MBM0107842.1 L,D-transpeptidase family protein [Steroidobacter gossypii]